jgi:hypothetical protein
MIVQSWIRLGSYEEAYFDNLFEREAYELQDTPLTDDEIAELNWEGERTDKEQRKTWRQMKLKVSSTVIKSTRIQQKRAAKALNMS